MSRHLVRGRRKWAALAAILVVSATAIVGARAAFGSEAADPSNLDQASLMAQAESLAKPVDAATHAFIACMEANGATRVSAGPDQGGAYTLQDRNGRALAACREEEAAMKAAETSPAGQTATELAVEASRRLEACMREAGYVGPQIETETGVATSDEQTRRKLFDRCSLRLFGQLPPDEGPKG